MTVGCGESGGGTSTPPAPERVILFGPNLSATAVRLGHADRIVALTDYCDWPADLGERPRVGGPARRRSYHPGAIWNPQCQPLSGRCQGYA